MRCHSRTSMARRCPAGRRSGYLPASVADPGDRVDGSPERGDVGPDDVDTGDLAGRKLEPTTGNSCSVATMPEPIDRWPMKPNKVTTTSSSGKIAVNPYQARPTTSRLALSSPNFFTTA